MKQRIVQPQWIMSKNFLVNTNAIAFIEKVGPNILKTHLITGDVLAMEYTGKGDPLKIYAKYLAGDTDENG